MKRVAAVCRSVAAGLGRVFLPQLCALCGEDETAAANPFCARCRRGMLPLTEPCCTRCAAPFAGQGPAHPCPRCTEAEPPFEALRAWGLYANALLDAIRQFKYGGRLQLRRGLEHLLLEAWEGCREPVGTEVAAVCCVPCHPLTLRARGFSLPALLSRALAGSHGLTWRPTALAKVRRIPDLVGLGQRERMRVVQGAYGVAEPLSGTVVLVDDVATTTATARACAALCREAGAERVFVLALARTPPA